VSHTDDLVSADSSDPDLRELAERRRIRLSTPPASTSMSEENLKTRNEAIERIL